MNYVILCDVSNSMMISIKDRKEVGDTESEQRIGVMKKIVKDCVRCTNDRDSINILTFTDHPFIHGTDLNKNKDQEKIKDIINTMHPCGSTRIDKALSETKKLPFYLKISDLSNVTLLLFTDGENDAGKSGSTWRSGKTFFTNLSFSGKVGIKNNQISSPGIFLSFNKKKGNVLLRKLKEKELLNYEKEHETLKFSPDPFLESDYILILITRMRDEPLEKSGQKHVRFAEGDPEKIKFFTNELPDPSTSQENSHANQPL